MEKQEENTPYLKHAFFSYLLLGITDTVHHLHASFVLGDCAAMHAAKIRIVLVPVAIITVSLFRRFGEKSWLRVFLSIAILAIAIPGMYHGGLNHLVKIFAHLIADSPKKNLRMLFPEQYYNLWFYEISGMLEFLFALVCSYYVYLLIVTRRWSA